MSARRQEIAAAAAVCLAAVLPYLRSVPYYFVQDDFGVVQLLESKPWSTFPRWFAMPWMEDIWGYTPDEIRPFPALSYQLTALWGAAAPEGHHLLNIALHAANALLVMSLARTAAGLAVPAAALAGVIFAVLPVGAESVAWITGRVDTMPALFYIAAFLAYVRWRGGLPPMSDGPAADHEAFRASRLYAWALLWYFLALFSKQNTITLPAALVACDVLVFRRGVRLSWAWARPYVPFAAMTAAFLALRYVVLGEVLRESQLTPGRLAAFHEVVLRHMQRIIFGDTGAVATPEAALALMWVVLFAAALIVTDPGRRRRALEALLFFGPVWLGLGLAPAVAAGYESPRHAYLAATGWAIVAGLSFQTVWTAGRTHIRTRAWRAAAAGMAVILVVGCSWRLHDVVTDWGRRAAVSQAAAAELERQVLEGPAGALVIAGAPVDSWEWASPFVASPPFASTELTRRAFILTPRLLDCCRGTHWEARTRAMLQEWAAQPEHTVIALDASRDGAVRRLTASDEELLAAARVLPEITDADSLDGALRDILRKLVAGRGAIVRRAF